MFPKSIIIQLFFGFVSNHVFSYWPHEFFCYEEFSVLRLLLQIPAHDKLCLCARGVLDKVCLQSCFFPAVTPWLHLSWRSSRKGVPMMLPLGYIFLSDFIFVFTYRCCRIVPWVYSVTSMVPRIIHHSAKLVSYFTVLLLESSYVVIILWVLRIWGCHGF